MEGRTIITRYEKNTRGRDFVCGDIHGCFDDLEYNLRKISFDPSRDRMFCVGDLFDRGPRSRDALDYLNESWFFPVCGNHEEMFLEWYILHDCNKYYSYRNGSNWLLREKKPYLTKLARAAIKLPFIIAVGDTLILHACLPDVPSLETIEQNPDGYINTILWHRGKMPDRIGVPGIRRVYCGHSVIYKAEERNGFINIDTGAFLRHHGSEGKLTVRELEG